MFWIGFIVGIIIGAISCMAIWSLLVMKWTNMSMDEISACGGLILEAGNNRASTMSVWHDGELLEEVEFEDK